MPASTPGDTEFSLRTAISPLFSKPTSRQVTCDTIWLVTGFEKTAEIAVLGLIRVSQEIIFEIFQYLLWIKVKNIDFEGLLIGRGVVLCLFLSFHHRICIIYAKIQEITWQIISQLI